MSLEPHLSRARGLAEAPGRRILGIAGPPGAGKTTLALAVVAAIGDEAVHVPLDGFHLADTTLERLGRRDRKGAPDTFDVDGYAALLRRLRAETSTTVYAPAFERGLEQPVAGSIAVGPGCRMVVTEGSYLLLDRPGWCEVRPLLDECWWVGVDDELRRGRLRQRHEEFGKTADAARAWVDAVDEPNAVLVAPGRAAADHVVRMAD